MRSQTGRAYCPPEDVTKCALKKGGKCGKPNPWIEFRVLYKGTGKSTPATYRKLKNILTPAKACRLAAARSGINTVPEVLAKLRAKLKPKPKPKLNTIRNILTRRMSPNTIRKLVPRLKNETDAALGKIGVERVSVDFSLLEERMKHKEAMTKLLETSKACKVEEVASGPRKYFVLGGVLAYRPERRAGENSVYGEVYRFTKASGLKIRNAAVKIQRRNSKDSRLKFTEDMAMEKKIIAVVNELLENRRTQNLPFHFSVMPSVGDGVCPSYHGFSEMEYQLHVMEAFDDTMHNFLKTPRSDMERHSAAAQYIHGLMAMEARGVYHNDAKPDNVMYKDVAPGGVWEYRFTLRGQPRVAHVPNTGQIWAVIDFSISGSKQSVFTYLTPEAKAWFKGAGTLRPNLINNHAYLIFFTLYRCLGKNHPVVLKTFKALVASPDSLLGNLGFLFRDICYYGKFLDGLDDGEVTLGTLF